MFGSVSNPWKYANIGTLCEDIFIWQKWWYTDIAVKEVITPSYVETGTVYIYIAFDHVCWSYIFMYLHDSLQLNTGSFRCNVVMKCDGNNCLPRDRNLVNGFKSYGPI